MARFLVLDHDTVCRLLPFGEVIEVMAETFAALGEGRVHQPLRSVSPIPGQEGVIALMPGYVGIEPPALGVKALAAFPGNTRLGLDTHQGAVLLFSLRTGELQALVNAGAVTSRRTAAVSALATRYLARRGELTLAVIGAGTQGRAHLQALPLICSVREAVVVDEVRARAQALVDAAGEFCGFPVRVVGGVEEALAVADIVVTTTSSREPIIRWEWIRPGTHLCAVGASRAPEQELDAQTVAAASLFADLKESLVHEAADYQDALRRGLIPGPEHVQAELADLVLGRHPGRRSAEEVTVFRSLGLAVEDVAAAGYVFAKAVEAGVGCWAEV